MVSVIMLLFEAMAEGGDFEELPLPPGLSRYEDYHTIDWQRDIARDRMRHRHIVKKKQDSICDLIKGAHDAWSGWLCVLLVGIAAGVCPLFFSLFSDFAYTAIKFFS